MSSISFVDNSKRKRKRNKCKEILKIIPEWVVRVVIMIFHQIIMVVLYKHVNLLLIKKVILPNRWPTRSVAYQPIRRRQNRKLKRLVHQPNRKNNFNLSSLLP